MTPELEPRPEGTTPGAPVESVALLPPQLRLLALLTTAEGAVMVAFAAATLLLAVAKGSDQWGAVWFVVVGLGIWGVGLGVVAYGLRRKQRWAFTPLVLTQLIFGLSALNFFAAATTPARVVWGGVVIVAVVMLRLAFGREVRHALVTPLG